MKIHCPEILVHEFMQAFHNILLSSPLCLPSLSLPLPLYLPYLSISPSPSFLLLSLFLTKTIEVLQCVSLMSLW